MTTTLTHILTGTLSAAAAFCRARLSGPAGRLSGWVNQGAPVAQLAQINATAAGPKQLVLLPCTDQFFPCQREPLQPTLASWLKEQLQ